MADDYGSTTTVVTEQERDNGRGSGDGDTVSTASSAFSPPKQTFSIAEPSSLGQDDTTPLRSGGGKRKTGLCCCPSSSSSSEDGDGLRIIIISMFVFAVAVTVALIFQIVSGTSPSPHMSDATVSDHPSCTDVGDRILAAGGNAVDAAVAASFCLAAVAPHMTGIGGGGVMLVHKHRENKTVVIDFRETTPENAMNERYVDNPALSREGRSSVGVPGFVAGMALARAEHGSGHVGLECCSWPQLVRPAIQVGRSIAASESLVNASNTKIRAEELAQPDAKYLEELVRPDGHELTPDETMLYDLGIYQSLLRTLDELASSGPEAFYRGAIGKAIVQELEGKITEEDLADYRAVERDAIQTRVGDFQVISAPSPSSGPQLLSFLNAMEEFKRRHGVTPVDAAYLTNVTQVLERTGALFLGLGDPDGGEEKVTERTEWMLDKRNAARFLNDVEGSNDLPFASSYPLSPPAYAHAATMDRWDNYVSVSTSLNTWFGSRVMTSTGILLNNALSDFAFPSGEGGGGEEKTANVMSRGRRPLYTGVPALAVDVERICGQRVIVGGSGADTVGQVLVDSVVFGQDLSASVARGRLHVLPPSPPDSAEPDVGVEGVSYAGEDPIPASALASAFGENGVLRLKVPYTTVNGVDKTGDTVLPVEDPRSGNLQQR